MAMKNSKFYAFVNQSQSKSMKPYNFCTLLRFIRPDFRLKKYLHTYSKMIKHNFPRNDMGQTKVKQQKLNPDSNQMLKVKQTKF